MAQGSKDVDRCVAGCWHRQPRSTLPNGIRPSSQRQARPGSRAGLVQAPSLVSLDASFNAIADLAGLEKLTRLQDLSLYCNRVSAADCLTGLLNLELLSLGPLTNALA